MRSSLAYMAARADTAYYVLHMPNGEHPRSRVAALASYDMQVRVEYWLSYSYVPRARAAQVSKLILLTFSPLLRQVSTTDLLSFHSGKNQHLRLIFMIKLDPELGCVIDSSREYLGVDCLTAILRMLFASEQFSHARHPDERHQDLKPQFLQYSSTPSGGRALKQMDIL